MYIIEYIPTKFVLSDTLPITRKTTNVILLITRKITVEVVQVIIMMMCLNILKSRKQETIG